MSRIVDGTTWLATGHVTPHEHYLEAERLLDEYVRNEHGGYMITPTVLTIIQIHATLACAKGEPSS